MGARRVQIVAMATLALLVPVLTAGNNLIWGSRCLGISSFVVLYAFVIAALLSTFARYRSDQQCSLAQWRRAPYITGVKVLLALCLLPVATWSIFLSGTTLHLRIAILCLLTVNAAAAILVWFGSGWSRLGLTVVAYWVWFLWFFPFGLRE
jgi:hypothetical protein